MHIVQYVQITVYPTCTWHHIYPTLNMKHSYDIIYTNTLYIILYKQHVHTLHMHNTACAQHHKCNMYNICITIVSHIPTTLSWLRNRVSSVLFMIILACCKPHYFHFIDVSFNITCHNINIDIIQVYNTKSYPHDIDLVYLSWLLFPIGFSWTKNLFMPFTYIRNHSATRMILTTLSNHDIYNQ